MAIRERLLPFAAFIVFTSLLAACESDRGAAPVAVGLSAASEEAESTALLGPYFLSSDPTKKTTAEHRFVLRNESDEGVTLRFAGKTCGCVNVDLGDRVVPPRGSRSVRVYVDLRPTTGRELQGVVLETDRGTPKRVLLNLDCYCYSRLAILPVESAQVRVRPGTTSSLTSKVAIYRPISEAVMPLSVSVLGPGLSARLKQETSRELSGGIRETLADLVVDITATSADDADLTPRQCRVTVSAAGDQVHRAFTWTPAMPIRLAPERLLVQPAAAGSSGRFFLRAEQPFRILRIESSAAWLSAVAESDSSHREQIIAVNSVPLEEGAAARGQLTIHTDHPAQPNVLASVFALGNGRPRAPRVAVP